MTMTCIQISYLIFDTNTYIYHVSIHSKYKNKIQILMAFFVHKRSSTVLMAKKTNHSFQSLCTSNINTPWSQIQSGDYTGSDFHLCHGAWKWRG